MACSRSGHCWPISPWPISCCGCRCGMGEGSLPVPRCGQQPRRRKWPRTSWEPSSHWAPAPILNARCSPARSSGCRSGRGAPCRSAAGSSRSPCSRSAGSRRPAGPAGWSRSTGRPRRSSSGWSPRVLSRAPRREHRWLPHRGLATAWSCSTPMGGCALPARMPSRPVDGSAGPRRSLASRSGSGSAPSGTVPAWSTRSSSSLPADGPPAPARSSRRRRCSQSGGCRCAGRVCRLAPCCSCAT